LQLSAEDLSTCVQKALRRVGLDFDSFRGRSPIYLSEGEKRRAALAGVLVMNPETLVLDEPTAGLDRHGVLAVSQILRDYHAAGKTVVIISHQLDLIFSLVDRIVLMKGGAIHFDDSARELLRQPHILEAAGLALPRVFVILQQLQQHGVDDVKLSGILKRVIKS
jgi:energy-coupling factor transport system ATP-binding protein